MKFEFLRLGGARPEEDAGASNESVQWLPRNRVRAKRPGDFAIVLLASGVVVLLGMVLVIARYGPAQAEATAGAAQVESPANAAKVASAPAPSADAPQGASAVAPNSVRAEALPRAETPLRSPPLRDAANAGGPQRVAQNQAAAQKLAMRSSDPEPETVQPPVEPPSASPTRIGGPMIETASIVPRPAAEVDPRLIFGQPVVTSPAIAQPQEAPAFDPEPETKTADGDLPEVAPAPPPRPEKLAAVAPVVKTAARPAPSKGGSGATWAVWFDEFPDQRTVAAKLNGLQGKYGPYLGGRTLTYTRTGKVWRARVSGLTEDLAQSICGKVKSAGSACAVGGRN